MKVLLRLVSAVLISFMLLVATATMGPADVEPRICETLSKVFKGMCWNQNNCAIMCREFEHFHSGHCRGFLRRCYCTKRCDGGPS
uniref:Knottins-like domain-containing protein n=1 Tax=Schrenkiella parvula TaxID=98039 RepID=E5F715_9BRAS|nr:unknown [Schrenkiella parvula]